MAKFAHFEDVPVHNIFDMYTRHAEAARDIHALGIKEMTGQDIAVDLVARDPNVPSAETYDAMAQYDAISISSGLTSLGEYNKDELVSSMKEAIERFQGHMPAIIFAHGNSGEESNRPGVNLTDFTRNGLSVGEANRFEGQAMIETHSSLKPNIAIENPLDTQKFQYVNMAPDLSEHEGLVRDFLTISLVQQKFSEGWSGTIQQLMQDEGFLQEVEQAFEKSQKNPDFVHEKVHAELRKIYNYDDKGYLTGVDGTSFSAPYQAGHISGAILNEEERESQNLPRLSTEEIMTIAKLSAEQVSLRESVRAGVPYDMIHTQNEAGQVFTTHGGHGVFSPEKFKALLDEAHKILETTPDIDRTNISYEVRGQVSDKFDVSFEFPGHLEGGLVFEKMLVTFDTLDVYSANAVTLDRHGEGGVSILNQGKDGYNWFATDRFFGEIIQEGASWNLKAFVPQESGGVQNANLLLHGYREDSLMGRMVAKYSDDIELQKAPNVGRDFDLMSKGAFNDPEYTYREQEYIEISKKPNAHEYAIP